METYYKGYRFTKDQSEIHPKEVHRLLEQTYWAKGRPLQVVARSMKNSLCFGVFSPDDELVGFARMITDYAVTYYVSDVVIDESHRNKSIGTHLIKFMTESEEVRGLKGVLLTTYAHSFYEKLGFERNAQKCMLRPAGASMHLRQEELPCK
ncbi:MAG: GNAT family N-acetyltransferase [Oscillospiraceae bacterium]|nr:GNAT family N-acetyltransferase [Oscillospiraceae bacterium]